MAAAAADGRAVALHADACARIAAGHAALLRALDAGTPIYGVSTGLGAALDTPIAPDTDAQRRVVLARMVGVGPSATSVEVRAMALARLAGLAAGRSGVSPGMANGYLGMLNAGVVPVVPLVGSVGQADLPALAHLAAPLAGTGEAVLHGETVPGADAMARAGVALPAWGPKDGLALVSSNAGSVGLAALALADTERLFGAWVAAGALALEGLRGNPAPLDPRAAALHPAPGQADAAAALRLMLDGSTLHAAPRRLQDPLSVRCLAPVLGSCLSALRWATDAVALELNSAGDNPAVLAEDECILPNANFDPTHLLLALDTLALALARVAALQGARVMKLLSPAATGLPRFLAPSPCRNGFATLAKTVAALTAEVGQLSQPMPAFALATADGVEDYSTMALPAARRVGVMLGHLRHLCAAELLVAAQACNMQPGIRLGPRTAAALATVRTVAAALTEDRPAAPDLAALAGLIAAGAFSVHAAHLFGDG